MKKTIQPTFNESEYDSVVIIAEKQGFSTPSGLVKFATMQYVNSFQVAQNKLNESFKFTTECNDKFKSNVILVKKE